MKINSLLIPMFAGFFVLSFCGLGQANIAMLKAYKEAYPDSKPKCINCHVSEKPKKDEDHELNGYAKKVKALADKPTAADYKKAGSFEDFGKK